MKTKILNANIYEYVKLSADVIKCGGVVAFGTETVYGLGANALNKKAVSGIFEVKGRPADNPLIVHVASVQDIYPLVCDVPDVFHVLAAKFMPGPLTLIMKKSSVIPDNVTAGLDTIAVRIPNNSAALSFLKACGSPIAAPSANPSGLPSPTRAVHVMNDIGGKISYILDCGDCVVGLESTVLDISGDVPRILRPGFVTYEELKSVIGDLEDFNSASSDSDVTGVSTAPKSPGVKYSHYSPKTPLVVVKGAPEKTAEYILKRLDNNTAAIMFDEFALNRKNVFTIGKSDDYTAQASALFNAIRRADALNKEKIYAQTPPDNGLGAAISNRLFKAAGGNVMDFGFEKNRKIKERAKDLVSKMTVEEKASQLRFDAPAIERFGIPAYNWWNEALHGVARAGTATVFPQAIGLAAIFDDEYLGEIADIIATEARAKYNEYKSQNDRDIYKGLTFWSPNINIFRDPRWGRGHETYGEDPYLTSRLGVAFIKGLQGDSEHMKTAACAKHYVVHSGPEGIRHEFDAIATKKDMAETYFPAFEAAVREAKVEAVMGAYNRTNGEPCCGSKTLMVDKLRGEWEFDGHFVSDCWAIRDFHLNHKVTKNVRESVALALKSGCDLNCGNSYIHLMKACEEGLITEENITIAAERLMATRIKLGMFDESCQYDSITYEQNDTAEHRDKSREAAAKSMVLLKNNGILPLDKNAIKTIAVIGPNADSHGALKGNYYGTPSKSVTFLEGIQEALEDSARVYYSEGCHLFMTKVEDLAQPGDRISEAVSIAKRSDVVVMCLGMDCTIEGEQNDTGNSQAGGDKADLNLPGIQQELLEAVVATGTPVILVLAVGSALAVGYAHEHCAAVIQAWYPGSMGGRALAELLLGSVSPSGKLPVTFYKSTDNLPEFTDYSMKNRTYRYFEEDALYPFGYGLTYSNVEVIVLDVPDYVRRGDGLTFSACITNKGDFDVEEVLQCYIKIFGTDLAVRNHSLCAFKRVALAAGEAVNVDLEIMPEAFMVVDNDGEKVFSGTGHKLFVGISQPDARSIELLGMKPVEIDITMV